MDSCRTISKAISCSRSCISSFPFEIVMRHLSARKKTPIFVEKPQPSIGGAREGQRKASSPCSFLSQ